MAGGRQDLEAPGASGPFGAPGASATVTTDPTPAPHPRLGEGEPSDPPVGLDASRGDLERALEENFVASAALVARIPGAHLIREPDALFYLTGVDHPRLNAVLQARFSEEDADHRIAAIVAHFDARAVPMEWWLLPSSTPSDLGRYLVAHGFHRAGDWPGMAADLHMLRRSRRRSPDFSMEQVRDPAALETWLEVHADAFGTPPVERATFSATYRQLFAARHPQLTHYLGRLRGRPVATASLFPAAGVAGIYNIATLDAVRGRGIGAAMTLHAAGHAAGEGYAIAVLASSQMGLPIYRRLGFQPVCRLRFLVRPPGHRPHGRAHRPVAGKATRISP